MKCEQCGSEFEAKRRDARFCSSTCRKASNRVTDKEVTDNSVTDNVTDKEPNSVTLSAVEELERGGGDSYEGVDEFFESMDKVIPESVIPKPENYGEVGCGCRHCRNNDGVFVLNHGNYKRAEELEVGELNRVSLPGDSDYRGVA